MPNGKIAVYNSQAIGTTSGVLAIDNLVAENIKSGVNVGGVVGNFEGAGDVGLTNFISNQTNELITNIEEIRAGAFFSQVFPTMTKLELPKCKKIGNASFQLYSYSSGASKTVTTFSLPKVETIDNYAFTHWGANIPTDLDLPECITIGSNAFRGAGNGYQPTSGAYRGLKTLNAPKVQTIGTFAFSTPNNFSSASNGLQTLNLPECLTIEMSAFRYCSALSSVVLPKCTSLGQTAFANCSLLTSITLGASQVCAIASTNSIPASSTQHITIYVPSDLIESYKVANNWATLYNNGYITFSAIS